LSPRQSSRAGANQPQTQAETGPVRTGVDLCAGAAGEGFDGGWPAFDELRERNKILLLGSESQGPAQLTPAAKAVDKSDHGDLLFEE